MNKNRLHLALVVDNTPPKPKTELEKLAELKRKLSAEELELLKKAIKLDLI